MFRSHFESYFRHYYDAFVCLVQVHKQKDSSIVRILKESNSLLPHVVLASTLLALVYPPSFTWFTTRFLNVLLMNLIGQCMPTYIERCM